MFYICYIDLYNKGSYELMEYFCRFYKKEIRIVYNEFDSAINIVIELPDEDEDYSEDSYSEDSYSEDEDSDEEYYSEDYRLNKIIKYHSQNFKSNFWGHDNFNKLSDDEYYEIIDEIANGSDNECHLPRNYIFYKSYGQSKDFVLNETFKRLIKMSLHFTSSDESEIQDWNDNFREYCENDFKEFVNYCYTTYPEYDNDNVDLKKLYLLDQTLNGLHQILH